MRNRKGIIITSIPNPLNFFPLFGLTKSEAGGDKNRGGKDPNLPRKASGLGECGLTNTEPVVLVLTFK